MSYGDKIIDHLQNTSMKEEVSCRLDNTDSSEVSTATPDYEMMEYLQLFHVKQEVRKYLDAQQEIIDCLNLKQEEANCLDENCSTDQDNRINPFSHVGATKNLRMLYCPYCKISMRYVPLKTPKCCEKCRAKWLFQCGTCDKLYKEMKSLREHVKHVCNKEPRFLCNQCDYKSHYERTLKTHQLTKHPKWSKRVVCPRCGETKQQQYIRKHMETVCGIKDPDLIQQVCGVSITRGNPKICPHCSRVFKRIDLYLEHKAMFGVVDNE
ncbi:GDNF-inducible zinc finger protein 1-like [Phymastichus coffea]|uniref:GDNF-inducible zinc finger protein 1-like n=1 Tax=Phymastichus coffea TaxID=108790 RepID=UPI00273B9D32|nr:GDNF-inducible zinc finger protein 1-like [Phymastichus coffea]